MVNMAAQQDWPHFYRDRTGRGYVEYVKVRYEPFISTILASIEHFDRVLELGCGTGTITKAIYDAGWSGEHLTASDICPRMCDIARERLTNTMVRVVQLSAHAGRTLRADVVHSHGMLEHFDDETIRSVIGRYGSARRQIHYVPGLYDAPSFGDERLMSAEQWQEICQPDEILKFNNGLDYALIFGRRSI